MEYYSDIKRKEVVIHVTMWMSLKSIMLSDRRQAQKTTECMVLVYMKCPGQENPWRQEAE